MRANEFIAEESRGKMLDSQSKPIPGVSFTLDGGVDLYRAAMMIAGMPDDVPDIDPYSVVTGRPFIVTYCEEERQMIKKAFTKMGIPFKELVHQGSSEPDGVNTQSPTFSGKVFGR